MKQAVVCGLVLLAIPWFVVASEKTIQLPPDNAYAKLTAAPGVKMTQAKCGLCHSTDYIVMQPRGSAAQWQAVVTKMIKVYGAPVNEEEAKKITAYLTSAYGKAGSEDQGPKGNEARSQRPEPGKK